MACQREVQGKGKRKGKGERHEQGERGHERWYRYGLEESRERRRQEQRRPARCRGGRMQDAQTLQTLRRERKGNGRRKARRRRRRWW